MKIAGYRIIDKKTGKQIGRTYTYSMRNRARAKADRLCNECGSYRYTAQPIVEQTN